MAKKNYYVFGIDDLISMGWNADENDKPQTHHYSGERVFTLIVNGTLASPDSERSILSEKECRLWLTTSQLITLRDAINSTLSKNFPDELSSLSVDDDFINQ
jgi:hypothetical protein